jgi:hypothetical protein
MKLELTLYITQRSLSEPEQFLIKKENQKLKVVSKYSLLNVCQMKLNKAVDIFSYIWHCITNNDFVTISDWVMPILKLDFSKSWLRKVFLDIP